MLKSLEKFYQRKYKFYHFYLYFFISMMIALFLSILQKTTNFIFISIFISLLCLLQLTKEVDETVHLKKFKTYHLADNYVFRLGLIIYLMKNKFIGVGVLYTLFSFFVPQLLIQNISLFIVVYAILFNNFCGKRLGENLCSFSFIITILLVIFNKKIIPYWVIFSIPTSFLLQIIDDNLEFPKFNFKKQIRINHFPLIIRYFIIQNWQLKLILLLSVVAPAGLCKLSNFDSKSWEINLMNYSSTFMLLIIFELLQDVNLEAPQKEYNRLKLFKVGNFNFLIRLFFSKYFLFSIMMMVINLVNIVNWKFYGCQTFISILLCCWYKFFEEKALISKQKATWQLSLIRSWFPSVLISLVAIGPIIIRLLERIK